MISSILGCVLSAVLAADLPADFRLPPPPGNYMGTEWTDRGEGVRFESGSPVIATSYFYWYDNESKAHIVNADGSDALTDHPPTLAGFSYRNPDWHRGELADMIDAGIDVLLPVYWATPAGGHEWSDQGLSPLVAAREQLLREGKNPPAIGLFYDTSSLKHNGANYRVDLTTDAGKRWFYGTIRNFYSQIPPQHRALIDGRPVVFLYAAAFAQDVDETLFPAVQEMFRQDFGAELFIVKKPEWPGEAQSVYEWGGALGPKFLDTAAFGPGYDHSAVPGRAPLVRLRDQGRFYSWAWERLLAMKPETRPWLVHLETWNEYHEGTDIAVSAEYGRQYIELTRQFADVFHAGERISLTDRMVLRERVSAKPGDEDGLKAVDNRSGDGPIRTVARAGRKAWQTQTNEFSDNRYMYFDAGYDFLYDGDETLVVTVTYLDEGPGAFELHYDSAVPELSGIAQAFRSAGGQAIEGSGEWRTVQFELPHARFADRGNGADFRLACHGAELTVAAVEVRKSQSGNTQR